MKSILDRAFRYVPSRDTDLRKTFERIRREREAARSSKPRALRLLEKDFPGTSRRQSGGE